MHSAPGAPRPVRPEPVLSATGLDAGYGSALVVRGLGLVAGRGEIVAIVGPNGSGKSTLLKTLAGLVPVRGGTIVHDGVDVSAMPAEHRAKRGIAFVPQEREVFASLTVRENLVMGGFALGRKALHEALERVFGAYPVLARLEGSHAGRLSGGERKTLAMARVMMASPTVVLLDEPTANLAPIPSAELLEREVPALARAGATVVLVEQRAVQALAVADWAYVLVAGQVEIDGSAREIAGRGDIGRMFLGARASNQGADEGAAGAESVR
ncbi:MAG TPA: ABC transporter ATP-binding protein [Acidimicrobiales bacterium]|nr:ABC transporter ATP-binding protein [Acidimicrobiales bacterium]